MDYSQTLDYLFHRLPMFSNIGASAFKKDLTNTIRLCDALGNPQEQFKSIHIAGTNGKGSTSHMLAAIFQTAGYKTGLYTSPHLKDFRERIKVDGVMCSEEFVVDFTRRMRPLIEAIEPSFFEITVAMAFEYFARQKVDMAIVEVGLGGRLDSTNIVQPELSIITNIGWDHMNMLGNTLEKIAMEKAGIIKRGVPVVIGEAIPEAKPIFLQQANECGALIHFAQEQRWISEWRPEKDHLVVTVADHHAEDRMTYTLDLGGLYQKTNLLTVLEAVSVLKTNGIYLDAADIRLALNKVKRTTGLHGRWETIHQAPSIVLDVAHNADGIRQLIKQLEISDYHNLHIVFGMVKDKDITNILSLLPKHARYYFTNARIQRALDAAELAEQALAFHLTGHSYPNVNLAVQAAIDHAQPTDLILVCGSVFIIGELEKSELRFK